MIARLCSALALAWYVAAGIAVGIAVGWTVFSGLRAWVWLW
jgi:hypothetical protein